MLAVGTGCNFRFLSFSIALIAYSMRVFKSVILLSLQEIQHKSYPLYNNPHNIDKNKIDLDNSDFNIQDWLSIDWNKMDKSQNWNRN